MPVFTTIIDDGPVIGLSPVKVKLAVGTIIVVTASITTCSTTCSGRSVKYGGEGGLGTNVPVPVQVSHRLVIEVLTQRIFLTLVHTPVAVVALLFVGDITITIPVIVAHPLGVVLIVPLWRTSNGKVKLMFFRRFETN